MASHAVNDGDQETLPDYILKFHDAPGWYQAARSNDSIWNSERPRVRYRAGLKYHDGFGYMAVDGIGRIQEGREMYECTINPTSGKFERLCVQTRNSFCPLKNSTWDKTPMRSAAPRMLTIATFPFRGIHWPKRDSPDQWDTDDWMSVACRYPAAVILICIMVCLSHSPQPNGKDSFKYLPFLYNGYRYPRLARNLAENREEVYQDREKDPSWGDETAIPAYRIFKPRYLCHVLPPGHEKSFETRPVTQDKHTPYLFISYTKSQFRVKGNPEQTQRNYDKLYEWAIQATMAYAESVGFEAAFWLDIECQPEHRNWHESGTFIEETDNPDHKTLVNQDVYTMSDVIRESESTIVIVLDQDLSGNSRKESERTALQQWGKRVWTFPEVLLSKGSDVILYENGADRGLMSKVRLAELAWPDAHHSRQLVEHFTNLRLSRLELTSIAMQCLRNRERDPHSNGDHAYVLMGLLRVRPLIDHTDSSFQAFARLSLPQDNDRLMERLVCLLPKTHDEPWDEMSDQYNSKMWDIYPDIQVCGVGENDTVIVDGFKGAMIQWSMFSTVRAVNRTTLSRTLIVIGIVFAPFLALIGLGLLIAGGTVSNSSPYGLGSGNAGSPFYGAGGFFFAVAMVIMLPSPALVPLLFKGKFYRVEPCLFGIEGYVPIGEIEEKLFGLRAGRLKWSPFGSPLSRHRHRTRYAERMNEYDVETGDDKESLVWTYPVEAMDPCSGCEKCKNGGDDSHCRHLTFEKADTMSKSDYGELKLFTFVDTFSMTATLFEARRPPVAILVGGSEGGMKRALACSYDISTGIMYRETVLRVPSQTVDSMHSLPRVRLGLKNPHTAARL